jgi:hypothetical protein
LVNSKKVTDNLPNPLAWYYTRAGKEFSARLN